MIRATIPASSMPNSLNIVLLQAEPITNKPTRSNSTRLPSTTKTWESSTPLTNWFITPLNESNRIITSINTVTSCRGDTIISALTDIVGGGSFYIPQGSLNFSSSANTGTVNWSPCPYAAVYEVVIRFHFVEVSPALDSVERCLTWPLGAHSESELTLENGIYGVPFKASLFFYHLASMLGDDTLNNNIQRLIYEPSLDVSIAAGGDELYNFITVNGPTNSIVQTIPEYTNVKGGYGVLSSRTMLTKRMRLSGNTIPELVSREYWHFKQVK